MRSSTQRSSVSGRQDSRTTTAPGTWSLSGTMNSTGLAAPRPTVTGWTPCPTTIAPSWSHTRRSGPPTATGAQLNSSGQTSRWTRSSSAPSRHPIRQLPAPALGKSVLQRRRKSSHRSPIQISIRVNHSHRRSSNRHNSPLRYVTRYPLPRRPHQHQQRPPKTPSSC